MVAVKKQGGFCVEKKELLELLIKRGACKNVQELPCRLGLTSPQKTLIPVPAK